MSSTALFDILDVRGKKKASTCCTADALAREESCFFGLLLCRFGAPGA
jgi:hypothetical protein